MQSDFIFNNFRSLNDYKGTVLCGSEKSDILYEFLLQNASLSTKKHFKDFQTLDTVGSPDKKNYSELKNISATTLRYIIFSNHILKLFNLNNSSHIVEIGGGFGGQAVLTNKLSQLSGYTIYDLPSVTELQRKFVGFFRSSDSLVKWKDGTKPTLSRGDLIISNYAFSELTRPMQEVYIERVIANYPMGYITWNDLSERKLGGLSVMDFCNLIPNVTVIDENPSTSKNNKILFWNN